MGYEISRGSISFAISWRTGKGDRKGCIQKYRASNEIDITGAGGIAAGRKQAGE